MGKSVTAFKVIVTPRFHFECIFIGVGHKVDKQEKKKKAAAISRMAHIKIRPAFLYQDRRCERKTKHCGNLIHCGEKLSEKLLLSTKLLVRSIGKPCVYKKMALLNNLEEMPLLYDYCFLLHASYHLSKRGNDEKRGVDGKTKK